MKKYIVTVNGRSYEVQVEEVRGARGAASSVTPVSPRPAPAVSAAMPAPTVAKPPASGGAPGLMTSPLPGVILKVHAARGKSFACGEVLLIIEAMKMENEILAPYDCTVEEVFAAAPQPVQTGDRLLKIIKR